MQNQTDEATDNKCSKSWLQQSRNHHTKKNVALRSLSLQVVFCRYLKTVAVATENNIQASVSPKVGHPKIYLPVDPLQKTVSF